MKKDRFLDSATDVHAHRDAVVVRVLADHPRASNALCLFDGKLHAELSHHRPLSVVPIDKSNCRGVRGNLWLAVGVNGTPAQLDAFLTRKSAVRRACVLKNKTVSLLIGNKRAAGPSVLCPLLLVIDTHTGLRRKRACTQNSTNATLDSEDPCSSAQISSP